MIAFLLNVLLLVVTCLLLVFSLYSSKLMVVSFSSKLDLLICKWFIVYNVHGVLSIDLSACFDVFDHVSSFLIFLLLWKFRFLLHLMLCYWLVCCGFCLVYAAMVVHILLA